MNRRCATGPAVIGLLVVGALAWGACGERQETPACQSPVARTRGAIRFADGGVQAPLGKASEAVLRLQVKSLVRGHLVEDLCTGVAIAKGAILTARHCFPAEAPQSLRVSGAHDPLVAGAAESDAECAVADPKWRVVKHPSRDIALVLSESWEARLNVPMVVSLPAAGAPATLAGYGFTESGTRGDFRSAPATIVAAVDAGITIQVESGGGCNGDSGGPLFAGSGHLELWGVLVAGSASCLGTDEVVPTAVLRSWVDQHCSPLWQE